jgi:hypothetical protein
MTSAWFMSYTIPIFITTTLHVYYYSSYNDAYTVTVTETERVSVHCTSYKYSTSKAVPELSVLRLFQSYLYTTLPPS